MLKGRILLVGEQPPERWAHDATYRARHSPMFPYPKGSAGHRLWEITDYGLGNYVHGLERVNLIPEYRSKWSDKDANINAMSLVRCHAPSAIFTCGARVAAAFGYEGTLPYRDASKVFECDMIYLPHPSGRCRTWNEPGIKEWVRKQFDEYKPVVQEWRDRRTELLRAAKQELEGEVA